MRPAGLLLFHGAGGDREHRHFVAIEERSPVPVRRVDFAYRALGPRRPPPRIEKIVDEVDTAARAWADELGVEASAIVLGGRSMGGRAASLAVAGGLPAAGLALLSYPLHPPGKPDKLRIEHFAELRVPCLFVSGDRDPFGTPDELREHLSEITGPVELVLAPGDGHDPKKNDDLVVDAVVDWIGRIGP